MVFNATFNSISDIPWRPVLLAEATRVPVETTDLPYVTDNLYQIMLFRVHLAWVRFELTTLVMIRYDNYGDIFYTVMINNSTNIKHRTTISYLKSLNTKRSTIYDVKMHVMDWDSNNNCAGVV
jgi:hypothetical protein